MSANDIDQKTSVRTCRILLVSLLSCFLTPQILSAGTLSGQLVDAADGVTPVHPVYIELLNPDTGQPVEGLGSENGLDGSYQISDIPPGEYKVYFDTYNEAEPWVDELYNDVPCNGGLCDRASLGNVLVVTEGSNVLDADLVRRLTISGRVTNEASEPFADIAIDVLDNTGALVEGAAWTNSNGEWLKGVPNPGTYYVKTIGSWTPGYLPEVWENTPCEGCDPVATGTPIEVGSEDVMGIDFQLDPLPSAPPAISGLVTGAGGAPIEGAAIDIRDGSGTLVGGAVWTDVNGLWTKTLPGSGTYFAQVVPEQVPLYEPKIWENTPCDHCDPLATGTPITVGVEDVDGIDFQLTPRFAISGRVTTENGTAILGAAVEILDDSGILLESGLALTDANGDWQIALSGPGTYYARTVGVWTPGFQPEIWKDHPCDDCESELLSIADPIVVEDGHAAGIDFSLVTLPPQPVLSLCEQAERQFRAYHLGPATSRAAENRNIPLAALQGLARLKVNWLGIMQPMYIDDALDSTLEFDPVDVGDGVRSLTEEELGFLIDTFQSYGINVYVTLAIHSHRSFATDHPVRRHEMGAQSHSFGPDESWPWNVNHPDHEAFVAEFWETYRARTVELATFLESKGVRMYSIGTETRNLFRTRAHAEHGYPIAFLSELQAIVNDVRAVFNGLVTYDMHYNEFRGPEYTFEFLWDDLDLDIIGISAYVDELLPEVPTIVPDVATLEVAFERVFRDEFLPAQKANSGRPMLMLEGSFTNSIGAPYNSHHNLGGTDSDEDGDGINDGELTQANLFEALFNVTNRYRENMKGLFIWAWPLQTDDEHQNNLDSNTILLGTRGLLSDEVVREAYTEWKAAEHNRLFDSSFESCLIDQPIP